MKTLIPTLITAVAVLALANCAAPAGPNTQRGAVAGGLLGAGAGAIIGHQSGHTAEGALIGAAVGGTAGGVYGNARDQEEYGR
jgi:uncharacterized protein YcfJ